MDSSTYASFVVLILIMIGLVFFQYGIFFVLFGQKLNQINAGLTMTTYSVLLSSVGLFYNIHMNIKKNKID